MQMAETSPSGVSTSSLGPAHTSPPIYTWPRNARRLVPCRCVRCRWKGRGCSGKWRNLPLSYGEDAQEGEGNIIIAASFVLRRLCRSRRPRYRHVCSVRSVRSKCRALRCPRCLVIPIPLFFPQYSSFLFFFSRPQSILSLSAREGASRAPPCALIGRLNARCTMHASQTHFRPSSRPCTATLQSR